MTSKECYVYITLPNQYEQVTAGKFVLDSNVRGDNIGRFVYGKSYLARSDAVELDPIELRLTDKIYETAILKGVFGAIRDASPDYWGRGLIDRHLGGSADEMEYLLQSPDDRSGALDFGLNQIPPAPKRLFNQMIELADLQEGALDILNEETSKSIIDKNKQQQIEKLLLKGTSMGGARPKAVVEADDNLWVAKFNTPTDHWDNALVEHAMLLLARECGLVVADSKVVDVAGKNVLLVKRFDREKTERGYLRSRMISSMTVLKSGDSHTERRNWSYVLLAEELRKFSNSSKEDAKELFKRMVFNALISNTDDHPRNHAFIAKNANGWHLSPAYDLTPTAPVSIERRDLALECGQYGRIANRYNLASEATRFLLTQEEALAIIEDMYEIVSQSWYRISRSVGVSEDDCNKIKSAFCYEGFNYDIK
jgi:serine/threonine-protein kinase HipA